MKLGSKTRGEEKKGKRLSRGNEEVCERAAGELRARKSLQGGGRYFARLNQRDATPASNMPVSINHLKTLLYLMIVIDRPCRPNKTGSVVFILALQTTDDVVSRHVS